MKEVLLVAVIQSFQQLPHERLDVALVEVHKTRLQQAHQIVVHVLKHQVKRPCETKTQLTPRGETLSHREGRFHAIPLSFLKSKASSLSVTISFMLMMLLWLSCRKILISLMAVIGKPSFSLSKRTFFRATNSAE